MRQSNGIALVTALLIMVVVGLLATGGALVTRMELDIARNDASSLQAHYAAQSGLQKYKTNLFQYFRWLEDQPASANPERVACFDRMGSGLDLDRNGAEEHTWSGNKITLPEEDVLNSAGTKIGSYVVTIYRDPTVKQLFTIESRGSSNRARATVRTTLLIENTGVLENAIFTGQGQANQHLNGGVTVRGGVYVVGDEDNDNNTVIGANGNFSMLNDYDLTNGSYEPFRSRVAEANRVADNLCASLRVDNGRVELNGSVKLGDPENWLLGTYIGDEAEDLIVYDTLLQCKDNKGICSEIGRFTLDLTEGGAPEFPELGDPPDPNADCTGNTWSDCIYDEATSNGLAVTYDEEYGLIVDYPSVPLPESCMTALESQTILLDNTEIDCTFEIDGVKQGFYYGPRTGWGTATLQVFGTVGLKGYDLVVSRPTDYTARTMTSSTEGSWNASMVFETNYQGQGGNIDMNSGANFLSGSNAAFFPDQVLGLVAEGNVYQRAEYVMAPIYAGDNFRIIKGNKLLGSVVANTFCTTSAGDSTDCNAGQNAEIVYVNTGHNKPTIMQYVDSAGIPLFKVLSYETR